MIEYLYRLADREVTGGIEEDLRPPEVKAIANCPYEVRVRSNYIKAMPPGSYGNGYLNKVS